MPCGHQCSKPKDPLQQKWRLFSLWIQAILLSATISVGTHNYLQPMHKGYFSHHVYEDPFYSLGTRRAILGASVAYHAYFAMLCGMVAAITDLMPLFLSLGILHGFKTVNQDLWKIFNAQERKGQWKPSPLEVVANGFEIESSDNKQ